MLDLKNFCEFYEGFEGNITKDCNRISEYSTKAISQLYINLAGGKNIEESHSQHLKEYLDKHVNALNKFISYLEVHRDTILNISDSVNSFEDHLYASGVKKKKKPNRSPVKASRKNDDDDESSEDG